MPTDAEVIRHLATKVMGWKYCPVLTRRNADKPLYSGGTAPVIFTDQRGRRQWVSPACNWEFAGMVWEKAREMGIYLTLHGKPIGWKAYYPVDANTLLLNDVDADSGPRAICLAIYRATGGRDAE